MADIPLTEKYLVQPEIVEQYELPGVAPDKLPMISVLVGLFVFVALTVSPLPGWSKIGWGIGIVLAVSFLVRSLQTRLQPSPEMMLYLAWVAWASTGALTAKSTVLLYTGLTTVAQIWIMIAIISLFCNTQKTLVFTHAFVVCAAVVVASYSFLTGEYAVAESGEARLTGMVTNANAMGFLMICATVSMAVLWMTPIWRSPIKYAILMAGFMGTAISIVLTSSRTSLMGLAIFYVLWGLMCYRKQIRRRPSILIVVLLMVVLGSSVYVLVGRGSFMSTRVESMVEIFSGEKSNIGEGSTYLRMDNYRTGVTLVAEHPIVGVGLDNFIVYTQSGLMAHSDYLEIISDTGIPGFILFFAIFVVLWKRCGRIVKYSPDYTEIMVANLARVFVAVFLVTSLGRFGYYDKCTWIITGSFAGYTTVVWRRIRTELERSPRPTDTQMVVIE